VEVRVIAGVESHLLVERVEACFKKLGFSYIENHGTGITGIEVQSPCHFIVNVEGLTRRKFGFPLRRGLKVESAVQLARTLGTRESAADVKASVVKFVEELCSDLPGKNWDGLNALKALAGSSAWD